MKIRVIKNYRMHNFHGCGAFEWCEAHGEYADYKIGQEFDVIRAPNDEGWVTNKGKFKTYFDDNLIRNGDVELIKE